MTSYIKTMREAREEMLQAESMSAAQIDKLKKVYEPMRDKKISTANANKLSAMMDKFGKDKDVLIQLFKADIPFVSQSAVTKLITKYNMKGAELNKLRERFGVESVQEEVELDEAKYTGKLMRDKSVVDYVKTQQEKNRKKGNTPQDGAVYHGANWVDIAADAIGMNKMSLSKKKAFDWDSEYEAVAKKLGEEVELDEKLDKEDEPKVKEIIKKLKGASQAHAGQAKDLQKAVTESAATLAIKLLRKDELDEAEAYSPKQIKMAIGIASDPRYKGGNYSGAVKAIEKIKGGLSQDKQVAAVLKRQNEALGENLDGRTREYRQHRERLESLRSKRLEARHIDPADIDTSATDDDIKSADKNIMMQLRKSVSLRGQYSVEFLDKKKVKVPQKIALAVIAKYNSLRKPMDKEKFQAKVAKSHRDLLMGLKENLDEKKKKDKIKIGEESTLDRMNKKLQEKKNG